MASRNDTKTSGCKSQWGGGGKALEGSLGVGEPARPSNPDPVPDPV